MAVFVGHPEIGSDCTYSWIMGFPDLTELTENSVTCVGEWAPWSVDAVDACCGPIDLL